MYQAEAYQEDFTFFSFFSFTNTPEGVLLCIRRRHIRKILTFFLFFSVHSYLGGVLICIRRRHIRRILPLFSSFFSFTKLPRGGAYNVSGGGISEGFCRFPSEKLRGIFVSCMHTYIFLHTFFFMHTYTFFFHAYI